MQLRAQQQVAFEEIKRFLRDENGQVFILKGYAGTGKTTLIKVLIDEICAMNKDVRLMAPTGRAAKILHDKTGAHSTTVHKAIYTLDEYKLVQYDEAGNPITIDKNSKHQVQGAGVDSVHCFFSINLGDEYYNPGSSVIIVDEASMISSVKSRNDTLHFGTDVLLDDLLTYARIRSGAKVIFVGDPAQLPPIGDNRSAALEEGYFAEKGYNVESFTLTEILRQSGESVILRNAMKVRNLLAKNKRNSLSFDMKPGEVEAITGTEVIERFVNAQPSPEIGKSIVVCYTNANVKDYNDSIRNRYFPGCKSIQPGDIVQIVKNNYAHEEPIFNGDFATVLDVDDSQVVHAAPVMVERNGNRERVKIQIRFRNVSLMMASGLRVDCYIIEDLLDSADGSINEEQNTAIYIDFMIRNSSIRNIPEKLYSALRADPFLNALHVKYGYAITGHKSQGGEWDTAYVDYTDRNKLNNDCLRWIYTATTRAVKHLYGINFPHTTPSSNLEIKPIRPTSKPFSSPKIGDIDCPYLPPSAKPFQKSKCMGVAHALAKIDCSIVSVRMLSYCDRYLISTPNGNKTVDCNYNGKGAYTRYKVLNGNNSEEEALIKAMQAVYDSDYEWDYEPPTESLRLLHSKIIAASEQLDIAITNVTYRPENFIIVYDLKTSGRFAYIQFYLNKNDDVTRAMPASDLVEQDAKLVSLIEKIQ